MPMPGGCARARCASANSTLAELGRLQLGGRPIPTLASLLALVAGRVPLLLEVKTDRDIWRWIPALRRELADYAGRFGVMSFDPRVLTPAQDQHARGSPRPDVLRASTPRFRRRLFLRLADPQFLAVELPALGQPWLGRVRRGRPLYALDRPHAGRAGAI